MRNVRKKTLIALSTLATVLLGAGVASVNVTANADSTKLDSFNASGASIRFMQAGETAGNSTSGIRFASRILQSEYDGLTGVTEVGALIAPKGSYSGALDLSNTDEDICKIVVEGTVGEEVRDGKFTVVGEDDGKTYYEYRAYIYGIPEENYDTNLDYAYYMTINGTTHYTETTARSIGYVASKASQDLKTEANDTYKYEVDGQYSRFNETERTAIDAYIPRYSVAFSDGNVAQEVKLGYKATEPTPQAPEANKWFEGWFDENGDTFDFTKPVMSDVVLDAKYSDDYLTNEQLEAGVKFNSAYSMKWFSFHDNAEEGLAYPAASATNAAYYDEEANGIKFNSWNTTSLVLRMNEITLHKGDKLCITYTNESSDQGLVLWYGAGRVNGTTSYNGATFVAAASGVATDGVLTKDITAETTLSAISLGSYNNNPSLWIKEIQVVRAAPTFTEEQITNEKGISFTDENSVNYFDRTDVMPVYDEAMGAVKIPYTTADNKYVAIKLDSVVVNDGDKLIIEYALTGTTEVGVNYGSSPTYITGFTLSETITTKTYVWAKGTTTLDMLGFKNWGASAAETLWIKSIRIEKPIKVSVAQLKDGISFTTEKSLDYFTINTGSVPLTFENGMLKAYFEKNLSNPFLQFKLAEGITVEKGDKIEMEYQLDNASIEFNYNQGTYWKSISKQDALTKVTYEHTADESFTMTSFGFKGWGDEMNLYIKSIKLVKPVKVSVAQLETGLDFSVAGSENLFAQKEMNVSFDTTESAVKMSFANTSANGEFVNLTIDGGLTLNEGDKVVVEYKYNPDSKALQLVGDSAWLTDMSKHADYAEYEYVYTATESKSLTTLGLKTWKEGDIYLKSIKVVRAAAAVSE